MIQGKDMSRPMMHPQRYAGNYKIMHDSRDGLRSDSGATTSVVDLPVELDVF